MLNTLKTYQQIFNRTWVQILIISLLVVISYANILQNGLSFDDKDFLVDWPAVKDSSNGLSAFISLPDLLAGELPTHHRGVYRPLRSVYYLFSLKAWGFSPLAFHLQGLVVHLLITITIYFIVGLIGKRKTLSFIVTAFFAVHPIHTEAITYTAASFDSLGILFFFASFYFYLKSESSKNERGATRLLSWLLAFLAFFTYELTLTLPLLILAYDFCFQKFSFKNLIKRSRIYLPYFILVFSYLAIRFLLLKIGNRADYLGPGLIAAANQAKLGTPEILFEYLYLLVFPLNLTNSYPIPDSLFPSFYKTTTAFDPSGKLLKFISVYIFVFPPLIVASVIALASKIFRKHKIILFCIAWFLISLLPVLNIVPQGAVMAERFLYIPSFGFCLLLGLGLHKMTALNFGSPRFRLLGASLIFIAIISTFAARTIVRNFDWKDQESVFLSALKVDPDSFLANSALSSIAFEKGNYDESIKYSQAALLIDDESYTTYHQIGLSYEKKGDYDKAYDAYQNVLKYEPKYFYANLGLGSIFQKQGKLEDAISEYKKAIAASPENFEAHFNLAGVYLNKKDYLLAKEEYQKALEIIPDQTTIHGNFGYIEEQTGNLDKAVEEYKKALELEPDNFYYHLNIGNIYQRQGKIDLAVAEFKKALAIKPEDKGIKERITELQK